MLANERLKLRGIELVEALVREFALLSFGNANESSPLLEVL